MALKPLDVAQKVKDLASLPDVCIKINQLAEDNSVSTRDITAVIETDAALTAKILRVANSSFYANATKVDDLNRAVMMIGTQGLRDIVWATTAVSSFARLSNKFVDMATFWKHSLYVGTVARALASKCRVIHKDRLFLSGLMHDIGHLALYQMMPEEMEVVFDRAQTQDEPLQVAEKEVLGFTHAAVGFALLKLWKIPDSVCRAVAYHHVPENAQEHRLESAIIHIADEIAKIVNIRGTQLETPPQVDETAWKITGLNEKIIDSVILVTEPQFSEAIALFMKSENLNFAA